MLKLKQLSKEQQRGRESECASKRVREEAKSQAINCSEGSICSTQLVKQANDWVHERRERDFHFTLSFLSLVAGRSMHYGRRTQPALRETPTAAAAAVQVALDCSCSRGGLGNEAVKGSWKRGEKVDWDAETGRTAATDERGNEGGKLCAQACERERERRVCVAV